MAVDWPSIYARNGDAALVAGQTCVLELDLQQPSGVDRWAPQDLTGRTFVQRVFDRTGLVLAQALGVLITDESATPFLRFTLPGTGEGGTVGLLPSGAVQIALRHEIAEDLDNGRDVLISADFAVARGATPAGAPGSYGAVPSGPATHFTVRQGGQTMIGVRYAGAPGRDGINGPTSAVTANATAVAGHRYRFDTTAGGFVLNLPADPAPGDVVEGEDDAGACDAHPVTIGRNGQTIGGEAADFTFNQAWGACRFTFNGSTWLYRRT